MDNGHRVSINLSEEGKEEIGAITERISGAFLQNKVNILGQNNQNYDVQFIIFGQTPSIKKSGDSLILSVFNEGVLSKLVLYKKLVEKIIVGSTQQYP